MTTELCADFWIDGIHAVNSWSFQFDTRTVLVRSTAGVPYNRRVWWGMPKLPDFVLKSTFYLYGSRAEAEAGSNFGGTGFLIGIRSKLRPSMYYTYAVTNWHVACRDGYSVIRLNKKGGGIDILELDPSEWTFVPRWHDIAAAPIKLNADVHDISFLGDDLFATKAKVVRDEIGPGEDVFMIGRFVDHDGIETNIPAARFGNISVMPAGKIEQSTGAALESYCVDIHSRTGYSGSPTFVYRTAGQDLRSPNAASIGRNFLHFLGIHWGQFPEHWEIGEGKSVVESREKSLVIEGKYVKGLSGMTYVIPAWSILELLERTSLGNGIVQLEAMEALRQQASGAVLPTSESASPAGDENPSHKEDFRRLLDAAAKSRKPDDQT